MTKLLKKAFEQVSQLPEELQDDIALQLLEDARSSDLLEKLADRALEEFRAGRTWAIGFDEL